MIDIFHFFVFRYSLILIRLSFGQVSFGSYIFSKQLLIFDKFTHSSLSLVIYELGGNV